MRFRFEALPNRRGFCSHVKVLPPPKHGPQLTKKGSLTTYNVITVDHILNMATRAVSSSSLSTFGGYTSTTLSRWDVNTSLLPIRSSAPRHVLPFLLSLLPYFCHSPLTLDNGSLSSLLFSLTASVK
jgi:hypothetical protein